MSITNRWYRHRTPVITLVTVLALSVVLGAAAPAVAGSRGRPEASAGPAEPGWPQDHLPESDPRPGDPGYLEAAPTRTPPPDGMTDAEFKRRDPAAFAELLPERRRLERQLLVRVRAELTRAGIRPGDAAKDVSAARAAADVVASTTWSPYGYLRFRLVPNTTSPYARNGYLGTLYFIYGIYYPAYDEYKWFTVSWPARSGNNRPADQSKIGVGPIPQYTWDFGFMGASWRGYEADGRVEFYPGKWRLDPWTGGPYDRAYLEVHGGTGSHTFAATSGCIRLYPAAISSLKSYYDTKMANKRDASTAHLNVLY